MEEATIHTSIAMMMPAAPTIISTRIAVHRIMVPMSTGFMPMMHTVMNQH
jgi:hypothetical protein